MEVSDRLKKIIFKKLYKDLSHVEIIPYENSIWFIDRDKKFWYLELKPFGILNWRYYFFSKFFPAFSLERKDYEPIIGEWVEQISNQKVIKFDRLRGLRNDSVENVLKQKIITFELHYSVYRLIIDDILNQKVNSTTHVLYNLDDEVEQILHT
jgi:hypothetical protein